MFLLKVVAFHALLGLVNDREKKDLRLKISARSMTELSTG